MNDLEFRLAEISMPRRGNIAEILNYISIRLDDSIEDIHIPPKKRPVVYINPTFAERYCKTNEHLFMLVISECYRLRLCQTTSFQGEQPEMEIVSRAIIHSFLCQIFPEEEYTSFFCQFYEADVFPECLLRPPPNYPCLPTFPDNLHESITTLWSDLYYNKKIECAELLEQVALLIGTRRRKGGFYFPDIFGGKYCHPKKAFDPEKHNTFLQMMQIIVIDENYQKGLSFKGRSIAPFEMAYKIKINPPKAPNKTLEKAIYSAGKSAPDPSFAKRIKIEQEIQQAWPTKDRRAFANTAMGHQPLLYRSSVYRTKLELQRVDIYLDISGSMSNYIKYCVEAILSCSKKLDTHIWLFSVGLCEISLKQLRSGELPSYGGTSISEVTQHIQENGFRSVVIVTDGWVGPVPQEYFNFCKKKANIQVVYTPEHGKHDLAPIANEEHVFPDIYEKKRETEESDF